MYIKKPIKIHCCCCSLLSNADTLHPMDCTPQASLSFTISQSLLKLMSIESVIPSNHLILCRPCLLLLLCNDTFSRLGFPGGASGEENACPCRRHKRHRFNLWVGKIPWRKAWQPTPVFLPRRILWTKQPGGVYSPYCPWGLPEVLGFFSTKFEIRGKWFSLLGP